jgi:hypothetical protein
MLNLQLCFASPLIMALIAFFVFVIASATKRRKNTGLNLLTTSVVYSFIGAVATLIFTIFSMILYTWTTGYSSGNAPLGWIFIYGPLGMSTGQLVALIKWFTRHKERTGGIQGSK